VRYRHQGAPRKLTLGSYPTIPLDKARELARERLLEANRGADPAAKKQEAKRARPAPQPTHDLIESVCAAYVERQAKPNTREASWREVERILKREIVGAWEGRRLGEITRADIHNLLDQIVDRPAPILANRTLAAFRRVCNWAIGRGIIEASPCDRVKAPIVETSRDRVLSDDEIRLAWKAFDKIGWPFGPLVKLLLLTGARRDEIGQGTWAEIDLKARTWTIAKERSKNGLAHEIPLSDAALEILQFLPRVAGSKGYVFTTNGETPVSGFSRAKEQIDRAMIEALRAAAQERGDDPDKVETPERWTLHDLRRTAASGMAGLGIAPHVVEAVLNHKSGTIKGVAAVYNRYSYSDEKRAALDAWARRLDVIVTAKPAGNVVDLASKRA
jgi:integrase